MSVDQLLIPTMARVINWVLSTPPTHPLPPYVRLAARRRRSCRAGRVAGRTAMPPMRAGGKEQPEPIEPGEDSLTMGVGGYHWMAGGGIGADGG
jgi:hypothetical protein